MPLLVAIVAAMLVGGCATAAPTLTSRFVRQGTPETDLGGPPRRAIRTSAGVSAVASQAIVETLRFSPAAADIEAHDPRLRSALVAVHQAPTLTNHLAAAREYQRLGILDGAYDELRRGALLDPNDPAILDATARVWRDWGLPGLGLSTAYRAVHAAPQSATARHTLGTLFYALGLRREARNAFEETVRLDPQAWYGWQNLCVLAMADGRTREAIVFCQQADTARRLQRKRERP
jgi:tetratricopeptide (TPR) repeat protein